MTDITTQVFNAVTRYVRSRFGDKAAARPYWRSQVVVLADLRYDTGSMDLAAAASQLQHDCVYAAKVYDGIADASTYLETQAETYEQMAAEVEPRSMTEQICESRVVAYRDALRVLEIAFDSADTDTNNEIARNPETYR